MRLPRNVVSVMTMERDQAEEQEWQGVLARAETLRRLSPRPTAAEIADATAELSVSRATLFRWLKRYRGEERAAALLNRKSGRRAGIDAFAPDLKAIVDDNITNFYATPEKPTLTRLWKRILTDCRANELTPPSIRRLKAYLATLDAEAIVRRREGKARAEARFLGLPGSFAAERAMQIVQIDHTKVDVTVVDPRWAPADRPSDPDHWRRRVYAHGGRVLSVAGGAVGDLGGPVFDARGDGQNGVVGRARHHGGMADKRVAGMHSRRQWRGIPCARLQARLRRSWRRHHLPAAGNASLWRTYRTADRLDDGQRPFAAWHSFFQRCGKGRLRPGGARRHDDARAGNLSRAGDRRLLSRWRASRPGPTSDRGLA